MKKSREFFKIFIKFPKNFFLIFKIFQNYNQYPKEDCSRNFLKSPTKKSTSDRNFISHNTLHQWHIHMTSIFAYKLTSKLFNKAENVAIARAMKFYSTG